MARPLRIERAGSWYHLTARGTERREIFRDDTDRRQFLKLLEGAVKMFGLRLHVYVLMSNHYHLIIELTEPNLARAIHWLNVSYSVWFNRRHRRSGHLFQGRYKSVLVDPQGWALELSRYVHLNPVRVAWLGLGKEQVRRSRTVGLEGVDRAQVAQRIAMLGNYPWSSFRGYIGVVKKPEWLTTETVLALAGRSNRPARRYREHCEEAVRMGLKDSPWDKLVGQAVLGAEQFVRRLTDSLKRVDPARRRLARRPPWEQIVGVIEKIHGERWARFRDRHGDVRRDLVLYLARSLSAMSIRELSERADIEYMSAATALRRFSAKARQDRKIASLVQQAMSQMKNK